MSLQTDIFRRRVARMSDVEKIALAEAAKQVIAEPYITGDMRDEDLSNIQVCKYEYRGQPYVLAYEIIEREVVFTYVDHGAISPAIND